jgi:hypothetical protein
VCLEQSENAAEEVRIIPAEKEIQFTFHLNSANTVAPCTALLVRETNKKESGE